MNMIYRGADYFTLIDPVSMVALFTEFVSGKANNSSGKRDIYQQMDEDSVPKLLDSMKTHGVPNIQVVYFPGIDLYTHLAPDPLPMEINYLETVTDPLVGNILDAYRDYGILDQTYVMVIADHGHTPVLKDPHHALGADSSSGPNAVVEAAGFRPRKLVLNPGKDQQDYQAAFAYQGAIAYVYLADRSTCPNPGMTCDWKRPPRYSEDVLPVARAFYYSSKRGRPITAMKDTLDLVFARVPTPPGKNTDEYEIFDGHRLVPIWLYLLTHRRPDLVQLNRRMRWLSAGPYGNRSGDVLLLSRSGLQPADPGSLLLLGAVSLMAWQRVAAGQPHPADRRAQGLSRLEAQAAGRRHRRRRTVATRVGANRSIVARLRAALCAGRARYRRWRLSACGAHPDSG